MAIRERLAEGLPEAGRAVREKASNLRENLQRDAEAADRQSEQRRSIVQRARAVLQSSDDPQARARARQILSRANPGTGAGQVDRRETSRTQRMFERAEQSAIVAAPIDASVDPTPDSRAMWSFASAGPGMATRESAATDGDGEATSERRTSGADPVSAPIVEGASMAQIDASGLLGSHGREPDWHDNPDHLDTPGEVRESLRDSGLDPMDIGTQEQATFGHFLVHSFADDEDLGGRTPAQLEAEHDLTVQAMRDFGVGHDSPLDRADVGDHPFAFGDEWGLSWGDD